MGKGGKTGGNKETYDFPFALNKNDSEKSGKTAFASKVEI